MIITLPTIGTGKGDDSRRPALPEGVGFTLLEDHGDTMTVKVTEDVTDWAIENGYLIPTTVTMRQARLALLDADLLDQVDAAIAAVPDAKKRRKIETEWEYAQVVERDSPLVRMFAAQLGFSDKQLDEFFKTAWGL